jgi:hypothetical protein
VCPSSRFALSLKPSVAYLVLNFCELWKKQTTLRSFAYAGIPYHVFSERAGPLALMIAWSRLAMARSGCGRGAIFASTSPSPSVLPACRPRASAFNSWRRSLFAARSSSVNPVGSFPVALVLLGGFYVSFLCSFHSAFLINESINAAKTVRQLILRRRWPALQTAWGIKACLPSDSCGPQL